MRHRAHVAHHVRGRLRIRVPEGKGNAAVLEAVGKSLAAAPGVSEVAINETTGSVTVHYDPDCHDDFHAHLAGDHPHNNVVAIDAPRLSEVDELAETLEREAEFLSAHSHSARAVFDFLKKCDVELKRATDNNVDLKVLGPLALAAYAFIEMGIEASTPVWLTLGLFSFNHFIDLHTPQPGRPVRSF